MKDQERFELLKKIWEIKDYMIAVATGKKDINDVGDYYKRIYWEVNKIFLEAWIKNPNPHRELRDFYNYRKSNWLDTYQSRRNYINWLYKDIELWIYDNKEIKNIEFDIWEYLCSDISNVSRKLFEDEHYDSAVFKAMKLINNKVKEIVKKSTGQEFDWADLMNKSFSIKKPIIILWDLETETGQNIQQGYMDLFRWAILAIRNPEWHETDTNTNKKKAIHFLFLANLLLIRLEEAGY